MEIQCPHCETKYNLNTNNIPSEAKLLCCKKCNNKFQIVFPKTDSQNIEEKKENKKTDSYKEHRCPFCGKMTPNDAIRCKFCGNFKKYAKLTIKKVRDDQAKDTAISELKQIFGESAFDWKNFFSELPKTLQLDYGTAIKLEIKLRNKGVLLHIGDGDLIIPGQNFFRPPTDSEIKFSETIYRKITFEDVLKNVAKNSSIKKELLNEFLHHRKDLITIIIVAFIPFLSLPLNEAYHKLFFPVFLGVLWAFIVYSFFGDGNVPIKKVVKYFLFSATAGALIAIVGNQVIGGIFHWLPKMLFYILVVGLVEEFSKQIPILRLVKNPKKKRITIRFVDIFVLSMICGIGFSATENILYKIRIDSLIAVAWHYSDVGTASISNFHFLRTISLPILHGAYSAIFGVIYFYGYTIGQTEKYKYIGWITAAIIHGIYDVSNSKFASLFIVFFVFAGVLVLYKFCIYIDEMKHKELNHGASNEI